MRTIDCLQKCIILLLLSICIGLTSASQNNARDTSYNYWITNARWVPDGKQLLVTLMKIDRAEKLPPKGSFYLYDIETKKLQPLPVNGGSPSYSPDGKKILSLRREGIWEMMIVYDINSKAEKMILRDSTQIFSCSWSGNNEWIAFNRKSRAKGAPVEVCVIEIKSGKVKQITQSGSNSSYSPAFAPEGNRIAYYVEKGDDHDQIWLTDSDGSFHRNLTNDTTTHNFYPVWIDASTIAYTQSPGSIITLSINGSGKKKVDGLETDEIRYNAKTKRVVYVAEKPENKVIMFDWQSKKSSTLFTLDQFLKMLTSK